MLEHFNASNFLLFLEFNNFQVGALEKKCVKFILLPFILLKSFKLNG